MKKALISGVLLMALATPLLASAQVDVNATTTASTTQQMYQYSLRQVIGLLMQQVQVLIAQLAALNAQQTQLQTQITTIQNQQSQPVVSTGGTMSETPVDTTDKTSLNLSILSSDPKGTYADAPFGAWRIKITATDSTGAWVHNLPGAEVLARVTVTKDGQNVYPGFELNSEMGQTDTHGNYWGTYSFTPEAAGTYNISVACNGLTKDITVVVE